MLMNYTPYMSQYVGLDRLVKSIEQIAVNTTKYPPYNISKLDDNKYLIEIAVAGFGKQDIEIELQEDVLTITGKSKGDTEADSNLHYLYRGIAARDFSRQFTLADTIQIKNAQLLNGMLRIWLENVIPDHKKPRKIEITEPSDESAEM